VITVDCRKDNDRQRAAVSEVKCSVSSVGSCSSPVAVGPASPSFILSRHGACSTAPNSCSNSSYPTITAVNASAIGLHQKIDVRIMQAIRFVTV